MNDQTPADRDGTSSTLPDALADKLAAAWDRLLTQVAERDAP